MREKRSPGFAIAEPPGARSCGLGGEWEHCSGLNMQSDLNTVKVMLDNADQFELVRRKLGNMLRDAKEGKLIYGKTEDVYQMSIEPAVLEIRLDVRAQFPDGLRKLRLYFSEPLHRPNVMVAARLRSKPATKEGLSDQNDHILESFDAIKEHLGL